MAGASRGQGDVPKICQTEREVGSSAEERRRDVCVCVDRDTEDECEEVDEDVPTTK